MPKLTGKGCWSPGRWLPVAGHRVGLIVKENQEHAVVDAWRRYHVFYMHRVAFIQYIHHLVIAPRLTDLGPFLYPTTFPAVTNPAIYLHSSTHSLCLSLLQSHAAAALLRWIV
jgi:hypothetical protein